MKLFLTGASGFVGAATLAAALATGHEVIAPLAHDSAAPRLLPFKGRYRRLTVDLRDAASVAAAIADCRPDALLHLAWWGVANKARFERQQVTENLGLAFALAEAAAAAGTRVFVGVGSQGEYGPASSMREDSLPAPTTLYGAAKVATLYITRQFAVQAGMRHVWLRLFSTYGPGDNGGWLIPMLITEMLAGRRPRTTLGTQKWDWLYIDDVARVILAAATAPDAQGVLNMGSGQAVQVRSVVERIRDLVAPGMELQFGEIPFRPDQVMHMEADISALTRATGWSPSVSIDEGLARTVAWHRALAQ